MECIFCKIVAGEIPADIVFQDEEFIAFHDVNPQAPCHILVIPKSHITSIAEMTSEQSGLIGRLILLAKDLAERENISISGYRLALNTGTDAGQIVPHLHLHILGGRRLINELG